MYQIDTINPTLGPRVDLTRSPMAMAPTKLERRATSAFSSSAPCLNIRRALRLVIFLEVYALWNQGGVNLIHIKLKVSWVYYWTSTRPAHFFQTYRTYSITNKWVISFSSYRKGTQTRIRVTKQYKGNVLTEISFSHTRAVIFGHLNPNLSRHRQPAVHFQKRQVCRMPALVEASGTIWRHIVAAEGRLRGIWAQGGQTYLPVYYWSCSTTYKGLQ